MFRLTALLSAFFTVGVNGACTLCNNGETPQTTQTPRVTTDFTCETLNVNLAAIAAVDESSSECKNLQLLAYQVGCCQNPPYEYCSVCPDGSDFERLNEVAMGTADDPTCAEIQFRPETLVGLFEQGTCDDTYLQRGAHYCGCPGVEQECFLCPDGAEPGNPNRGEGFAFGSNCRGIMYTYSLFKEDECSSVPQTFGFDAAAFCLCPNYEPSYDYKCFLCDEGTKVEDPSRVWTTEGIDKYSRTCEQAEEFAQYFTREGSCTSLLAPAREACCTAEGNEFSGAFSVSFMVSSMVAGILMIKNV